VVVYNRMSKTAQAGTVVPENFFKLFQLRGQKLCKYIMT
jgi:predicted ribosome quality control (RQC) complex YloA/Tae2 family protein